MGCGVSTLLPWEKRRNADPAPHTPSDLSVWKVQVTHGGASTCTVKYAASRPVMSCQGLDRESQRRWLQAQVLKTQQALGPQRMKREHCFHSDRGRSRGRKSCPGTGFP